MSDKNSRIYMQPEQPGWYVLRDAAGRVIEQGEERNAEFCCLAREMGPGAAVEETQHPTQPGTPFGFHYIVMESELRDMARFWKDSPYASEHCKRIVEAWS